MNSVQILLMQAALAYLSSFAALWYLVPAKAEHQAAARLRLITLLGIANLVAVSVHPGAWHAFPQIIDHWKSFAGDGFGSMSAMVLVLGFWMQASALSILVGVAALFGCVVNALRGRPLTTSGLGG